MGGFGAILHSHSEYSTRDSLLRVDELARLSAERGWSACALTDHGGIEGLYDFGEACAKHGIKPIMGCELYVGAEEGEKARHLTILCKSAAGFLSLCKVLSIGYDVGYSARSRKAVVPWKVVLNNLRECVVLSGCASSPFWREADSLKEADPARDLAEALEAWGEDFFFEVQGLWDWPYQVELNRRILSEARKAGRPVVVTPDCHMAGAGDSHSHEALLCLSTRPFRPLGHPDAWKFSTVLSYLQSPEEMIANLSSAGFTEDDAVEALANTELVAARIAPWKWSDLPAPVLPSVGFGMRESAEAGLKRLGLDLRIGYPERLREELAVFEAAGVGPYLALVQRCVDLFRAEGAAIGPRGSVGGSLVAYTMGLTALDPIVHGLSWQRFYAPGRKGWPDVDIDLSTDFRPRVPDVLRGAFGEGNVAQISNYMRFGPRSAIRAAARAYSVDLGRDSAWGEEEVDETSDEIKEMIDHAKRGELSNDERHGLLTQYEIGDKLADEHPRAFEFAKLIFGRMTGYGTHAGGFVLTTEPASHSRAPIVIRGKEKVKSVAWDMDACERLGFVKIDFLGNDALKVIGTIDAATKFDWREMPLDDEKVFADFREGRTAGIPQFLTSGLRTFVEMLQPSEFEDLVWANAAFRPGAIGMMSPRELAAIRRENPDGLIVYQEDVMELCVTLAGFSWQEADAVRKIIGKKKGSAELAKWKDRFVQGCVKGGAFGAEEAAAFWETLYGFARYAFNKCVDGATTVVRGGAGGHDPKTEITVKGLFDAQRSNTPWGRKIRAGKLSLLRMCDDGRVRPGRMRAIYYNGCREVLEIRTHGGRRIVVTPNHRLLTASGYIESRHLVPGSALVVMGPSNSYRKRGRSVRGRGASYDGCGFPGGRANPSWIDGRTALLRAAKDAVSNRSGGRCEFCREALSGRYEFAHLRPLVGLGGVWEKYHSPENLRVLCNPCHKRLDYKKGERVPRWTRGRPTEVDYVDTIKRLPPRDVFDVEMAEDDHNFIADGIVSHNSHAAAYSWNAYRIAWAKRAFPAVAFAAMLNADPDSAELIIDEAEDFGVGLLPPHVHGSGLDWVVEGNGIRAPLTKLPLVDGRIANAILKRRDTAGPFKNERDFNLRMGKIKRDPSLSWWAFNATLGTQFISELRETGPLIPSGYKHEVKACDKCEFRAGCRAPVPPEIGRVNVVVVGEAPGKVEDRFGKPFVGESGKLLSGALDRFGIAREDVCWTNTVLCKPPYVPAPNSWEDPGCPWLVDLMVKLNPPLVLAVGRRAWQKMGGEGGILKANATVKEGQPVVVACVHPAAVLRDASLLPELERAVRKFARLYRDVTRPERPRPAAPPEPPKQEALDFEKEEPKIPF